MPRANQHQRAGFTLVELLIVMAVIGIIISLILVAAADGVRRAEERATQGLIAKLETALNDRLDSLLNTQPPINQTHRYLAAINFQHGASGTYIPVGTAYSNSDDRRAQVIAQKDYLKAELPDVFFPNWLTSDGGTMASSYPLNFAAAPYPAGPTYSAMVTSYLLPLGNNYPGLPQVNVSGVATLAVTAPGTPTTGMFGASFSAASGIYKQLYAQAYKQFGVPTGGPTPRAYDGIDNDGNGYVDDLGESGVSLAQVEAVMASHTHKTARSEMLYALLVEGLSPLGSVFTPDDFTAREVGDTDGDGLLEFIDAWGEPLQFYRWPVYYGSSGNAVVAGASDSQKGSVPYTSGFAETRQIDPLDTNQYLVAPGWWTLAANPALTTPPQSTFSFPPPTPIPGPATASANQCSQGAIGFMNYFHTLVDPYPGDNMSGKSWDRGGTFFRRSYFSRFLIISGGPDHEPGVAQLANDYSSITDAPSSNNFPFPNSSYSVEANALWLIYIENQASQADPNQRSGSFLEIPMPIGPGTANAVSQYLATDASADDISNHNLSAPTTGVR